jgi:dipeptidyl aminopeptidase/acylaminoacyl peptidase
MAIIREIVLRNASAPTIRGSIAFPSLESAWPLAVLCHGIPSGAPSAGEPGYDGLALRLAAMGAAACWFNFRGTGESDGNFSLPGWVEDLEAVLEAAASRQEPFQYCDPARVALMGFSGGGAVCIICAARHGGLRAVAALSSPSDFTRLMTRSGMAAFIAHARSIGIIRDPGFPPSEQGYYEEMLACRPLDSVVAIAPVPLLIMHGDQDDVVPPEEAERLFEAAGEPKELHIVKGGGHRLRFNEDAMKKALPWLAERLLAQGVSAKAP